MANKSIEELVARARTGDRDAFGKLVQPQLARLEEHVARRLGARVREQLEAQDVVQETLLKACSSLENFVWHGEAAFFGWLARIAEHVIWKASKKTRTTLVVDPPEDDRATPATRAARRERARRLDGALRNLSADHRTVVRLTRIEGLPIAEVAEQMDRSPNAVKKLLARALDELRRCYGESTGSLRVASEPSQRGEAAEEGGSRDAE